MKMSDFTALVRIDPTRARAQLEKAGKSADWEIKHAAPYLGVSRATLHKILAQNKALRQAWDAARDAEIVASWD